MSEPVEEQVPSGLREVGHLACWSVSSAKPGNGAEMLRDGRADTFWQSDGLQPHLVSIQFDRCMSLSEVHIHVDFKLDESYTPNKISVQAGIAPHDVKEIKVVDLEEPSGFVVIPLNTPQDGGTAMQEGSTPTLPLQAYLLQLSIVSNHQNGRDTHVRQVKLYGQVTDPVQSLLNFPVSITSPEMAVYSVIR